MVLWGLSQSDALELFTFIFVLKLLLNIDKNVCVYDFAFLFNILHLLFDDKKIRKNNISKRSVNLAVWIQTTVFIIIVVDESDAGIKG